MRRFSFFFDQFKFIFLCFFLLSFYKRDYYKLATAESETGRLHSSCQHLNF